MKILIYGVGGVGGFIGSHLQETGFEIALSLPSVATFKYPLPLQVGHTCIVTLAFFNFAI